MSIGIIIYNLRLALYICTTVLLGTAAQERLNRISMYNIGFILFLLNTVIARHEASPPRIVIASLISKDSSWEGQSLSAHSE
ncbi:MAG: hypothetical protein SGJ10_10730 [Bacteroidota bacterium]|nr:hypothetical protein [Bacteroidota bacterium]